MRKKGFCRSSLRAKMIGINVSITLTSFILCGLLFIMSVNLLVGKYVNHDLDFFLTEMSDNLNTRMSYMEDVIYNIRDSEELMAYLENRQDTQLLERERIERQFRKEVNISSEKNQGEKSVPIVDKVYLFDKAGNYYSSYYYALVESQIQSGNQTFEKLYEERSGQYECRQVDGRIYLLYALLDESMDSCGTVIYELNREAVQSVMEDVGAYKNAFWLLYDDRQVIAGKTDSEDNAGFSIGTEAADFLRGQNYYEPYTASIQGSSYRIYREDLSLRLHVALGIPENQAILVLYDSVKIYVLGIVVILLGGLVSFVLFTYKMTRPIKEVTSKMSQVQGGDFETKLPDYDNQEFHEISTVFNEMTEYINHLVNEVYEKQIAIKEMELKFLQTQMNPHFMFNVLNSIALQARMDGNEEVFKMISSFSQLIQAKIYRNNEDKVQIRQELEYVQYYLYLQNLRYGDRLQYEIEVREPRILDMYIPKLCMQLIVENAVVHGIEPKTGDGRVEITIYDKERSIYIDISDNGVGFTQTGEITLPIEEKAEDKSHNHVGLNNAHHIIRLMYGEIYGIQIFSNTGLGTMVRIHIPFDEGQKGDADAV